MESVKKALASLFTLAFFVAGLAQSKPVHDFWQDDSLVKVAYLEQAKGKHDQLMAVLPSANKKDYEWVYKGRFAEVKDLFSGSRTVTDAVVHGYLQAILKRIVDANPELKDLPKRVVFSRDWWPNAYSMGEGTIAFNGGLFVYLNNEAEVAFVLCHELAHYYLDHSQKRINKMVAMVNNDSLEKEYKKLVKQEYNIGASLQKFFKSISFDIKRHSREGEEEADRVGLKFLENSGYAGRGFISAMQVLDHIDDTSLFRPLNLTKTLSFPNYPFKEKWIKKESSIFGAMNADEEKESSKKERDSLKTHPDCSKRISLLEKEAHAIGGKEFLVDENLFHHLKQAFIPELVEEIYRSNNISFNLYLSLQLLQEEKFKALAIYSIARNLNRIYTAQKQHRLGMIIDSENRNGKEDYNQLIRMIYKMRLHEIAELNYHFCLQYKDQMAGYFQFDEEFEKANKNKTEHQE